MGILANHMHHLEKIRQTLDLALSHFDRKALIGDDAEMLRAAADRAFSDEILLEKFRLWVEERDDEFLMFHVKRFFAREDAPRLSPDERDQTHRRKAIESEVKNAARESLKQVFAQRVTSLALTRGLDSNAKLGEFLGISEEQARKYRLGDNKPQLATLRMIAEKFSVRVEYLSGLRDEPN